MEEANEWDDEELLIGSLTRPSQGHFPRCRSLASESSFNRPSPLFVHEMPDHLDVGSGEPARTEDCVHFVLMSYEYPSKLLHGKVEVLPCSRQFVGVFDMLHKQSHDRD